jgi:hypothetical protein
MVDGIGSTKYAYNSAGLLQSEDGPWDSDTVNYGYNNYHNYRLRNSLSLEAPNGQVWNQGYGYDAAKCALAEKAKSKGRCRGLRGLN